MTKKLKPSNSPLPPDVQEAVLDMVVMDGEEACTIRNLLSKAQSCLELANTSLAENPLLRMTANHLMRAQKKRGNPTIVANIDGTIDLRVSYGHAEDNSVQPPTGKLPSLPVIRKMAEQAGVDVSDLGRQKLAMLRRISAVTAMLEVLDDPVEPTPPDNLSDEVSTGTLPKTVRIPRKKQ